MVETYHWNGRTIRQIRSKGTSSTAETYHERGRNITPALSKHNRARSKHHNCDNIHRSQSKHTLSKVEINQDHIRKLPRVRSKLFMGTVETYLEEGRNTHRARSKHTTRTVELFMGTVETYIEGGRNIHRARLKNATTTVKTIIR